MPIRPRASVAAGLVALVVAGLTGAPAPAATAPSTDLTASITSLSPTSMTAKSTVTLQGVVANTGDETWTDLQAYMVIRPTPLTSRAELTEAVAADGFAGPRIIDVGRFEELGDLAADQSVPFRLEVPADELPISRADGVYPVGVQILATTPDGERSTTAAARATTLLPRMVEDHPSVPTTVVWTFLLPAGRLADDRVAEVPELLASIGPEGRLRHLLDLALGSDASGRGAIVDPALVEAVDDLAEGRASDDELTEEDRAVAASFRDDLVRLAREPSSWTLDYDRTDVLALASDSDVRRRLFGAVERATDSVIGRYGLSRERVSWPSRDSVDNRLAQSLRERGDDPVVVSSTQLPDWTPGAGVLLRRGTSQGDLPMLVNDEVARDLPGARSWATVRQQIVSSAALASFDPESSRAALVVVDPGFDPGTTTDARISQPYLEPRSLDRVSAGGRYSGGFVTDDVRPIDRAQLDEADDAARGADLLSAAAVDGDALGDAQARALASVLGIRWRSDRDAGLKQARALNRRVSDQVDALTVMAPPTVTLSSSKGGFPLTISNGTDEDLSVGVRLGSSNPALSLPDQEPVEIAAGERQTITVELDLKDQNATTVTARLTTPDGRAFGTTEAFIVKSSQVGVYLWVTMGAAGLLVAFALVRRVRQRRQGATGE